jgi:hypothetical protein
MLFLGSLSLPDKDPEAALEAAVVGFLPALGVFTVALEAVAWRQPGSFRGCRG